MLQQNRKQVMAHVMPLFMVYQKTVLVKYCLNSANLQHLNAKILMTSKGKACECALLKVPLTIKCSKQGNKRTA